MNVILLLHLSYPWILSYNLYIDITILIFIFLLNTNPCKWTVLEIFIFFKSLAALLLLSTTWNLCLCVYCWSVHDWPMMEEKARLGLGINLTFNTLANYLFSVVPHLRTSSHQDPSHTAGDGCNSKDLLKIITKKVLSSYLIVIIFSLKECLTQKYISLVP